MLKKLNDKLEEKWFGRKVLPLKIPRKSTASVVDGTQALYDADENCKNVFDKLVESLHLQAPISASRHKGAEHEDRGVSVSA